MSPSRLSIPLSALHRRGLPVWTAAAVLAAVLLAGAGCAPAPPGTEAPEEPQVGDSDFPCPPTEITSALATPPADFSGIEEQVNFDLFSWLSFIAFNWPTDPATCGPDTSQSILSGTGPVVWQAYLSDDEVFVPEDEQPSAWCAPSEERFERLVARLPGEGGRFAREASQESGVLVLINRIAKAPPALVENFPDISELGEVVTDQNGRFVRYEVHLNQDEYGYLTDPSNALWSKSGQEAFTGTVDFPVGPSQYGPTGAVEVKASWKVLTDEEAASGRFYTTEGIVFNDAAGDPSPGPVPVTLGLVGMHLLHKTELQTNWIWSTFEQVDNLTAGSFHDPNCSLAECPPNTQTASQPYTELAPDGQPLNKPVQVTRITPILNSGASCQSQDPPPTLNEVFQGLLAGSVWQYYQLISTQWTGELGTTPKPKILANVTIETFIQAKSSCIDCHRGAKTTTQKNADFSYLLGTAK